MDRADNHNTRHRGRRYFGLLKRGLRLFSVAHTALYRLTGGRFVGRLTPTAPTLLLTTVGRKSGKARTVPLIYLAEGSTLVVVGSMGGSATHPEWWLNLRAAPEAQVTVGGRTWRVRAEEARGTERERLWARLVQIFPGFASYQRATSREIPVILLQRLDDKNRCNGSRVPTAPTMRHIRPYVSVSAGQSGYPSPDIIRESYKHGIHLTHCDAIDLTGKLYSS